MPVVRHRAPVSNRERQRQFRERNPHYYRDLHRKRKAEQEATAALVAAHPELTWDQAYAISKGHTPAPGSQVTPRIQVAVAAVESQSAIEQQPAPPLLALPAARSEPLVTVQLPLFAEQPEPVPVTCPPAAQPRDLLPKLSAICYESLNRPYGPGDSRCRIQRSVNVTAPSR